MCAERLLVLGPIVEDRPAIEEHHLRHGGHVHDALPREIDAVIEAEQVEGRLDVERVEHLVGGKVLHADDDIPAEIAEAARQALEGRVGDRLELGEARRRAPCQSRPLVRLAGKNDSFLQREVRP